MAFRRVTSLGPPALQQLGVTPASTDPAIATLFAIESSNYGAGVVHIASPQAMRGASAAGKNVLAGAEREIGVRMSPADFATRSRTIPVAESLAILQSMGINTPARIYSKAALDQAIQASTPMTEAQIQTYIKAVGK